MPSVEWNKKWGKIITRYLDEGSDKEKFFGDRWGDPNDWPILKRIRDNYIIPFCNVDTTALEIGFGGGRWTQFLLDCRRLYLVELNDEMFHYALWRFGARANISFCQTSGVDFPSIPLNAIDFVFSFGVFVHLDPSIIRDYLENMKPHLRRSANVVIQYSDVKKPMAEKNPGFSRNTRDTMIEIVNQIGFEVASEDLDTLPNANVIHLRAADALETPSQSGNCSNG